MVDTEHVNIISNSHEENSIVERRNKYVVRHLHDKRIKTCLTNELPSVERIINSLTVESLDVAPSRILFGNAIDLDKGIFLPSMTEANAEMKISK